MANSMTEPFFVPAGAAASGDGLWVGPRMKLPSMLGGGSSPSGSSFALTYPGVCGSRVGGAGRSECCAGGADWQDTDATMAATDREYTSVRERVREAMWPLCSTAPCPGKRTLRPEWAGRRAAGGQA